jgi:hypothetical protein
MWIGFVWLRLRSSGRLLRTFGFRRRRRILIGIAKKAVRDWKNRDHKEYWESVTRLKQSKG